jgi:hypothetical protein
MNPEHKISFAGLAGITPSISTFLDIVDLHGTDYELENMPGDLSLRRVYADKSLVRYRDLGIVAAFVTPEFCLLPSTRVSVVGAEAGCSLTTVDGIRTGMRLADAMAIIKRNYTIRDQFSDCIEILPAEGRSQRYLGLHHNKTVVEYIGLYSV